MVALQSPQRKVFTPLKKNDEFRAAQKIALESGDTTKLVASVEGTVKQVADHFGRGLNAEDMEDLYAAGRVGAVIAAQRYNAEDASGCSFNSYAFHWIRNRVIEEAFFFWGKGRTKFHQDTQKIFVGYGRAEREINAKEIEATPENIAEILGVTVSMLLDTMNGTTMDLSFDATRETSVPLHESIPDPESLDFFEDVCEHFEIERVERAIGRIDIREGFVLRQIFFEDKEFGEIAELLQVSKTRVGQIRDEAIRHLQEVLTKCRS